MLTRFCETTNPLFLFNVSDWAKQVLLQIAPTSLALHGASKSIYTERALYVLDILSEVEPLHFACEDFEPLNWIGSSCYVDSDLMVLLAVPNQFITDTILNVKLTAEPVGRHNYVCTKKLPIGQKANPVTDLANRKKVQGSLVEIAKSLRGTGDVPNCTSLRKILAACPHPENFHMAGDRDAGEYLAYILSMFPASNQATVTTTVSISEDDGETWTVESTSTNERSSIVWNVLPATLKKLPSTEYLTLSSLLEDVDTEDTDTGVKETNTTMNTTPYLVLHANRGDPDLEEDDEDFMIDTKILPTEHITFLDGSRVVFSGVVMWKNGHYTAYLRCGTGWYYYDDTGGAVEDPISYKEMLSYDEDEDRPLVQVNGTLYFYTQADPIVIPVIRGSAPTIRIATINAYLQAELEPFYDQLVGQLGDVDVVCIQEAPPGWAIEESALNEHYTIACESLAREEDEDCNERLTTLISRSSKWKLTECSVFWTELCETERVSQLVTFTSGSHTVRVGNVHLCGGKYDEENYGKTAVGKLAKMKQEAIEHLAAADVILGDFNSIQNPLSSTRYVNFMKELGWNDARIVAWNNSPFEKLTSLGFKRVDYNEPTSTFGSTPDSIWYKPSLAPVSVSGIDMGAKDMIASDHNGISVEFKLT